MIARLRGLNIPRGSRPVRLPRRILCDTDGWSFDPRYTQGRCPICGWAPDGVPAAPRWLALVNRMDWQMIALVFLADVLVLLGLIVVSATGALPAQR